MDCRNRRQNLGKKCAYLHRFWPAIEMRLSGQIHANTQAAFGKTKLGPKRPSFRQAKGKEQQKQDPYSIYSVPEEEWIYISVPPQPICDNVRLVEVKAVSNLLEDRWNVLKFNLEQEAHRGLHAFSEKNKRTRQYRVSIAKKHIEILRYREHNSRTLAQKSQLRDLIKIRHQWEDELASLVPIVDQDG